MEKQKKEPDASAPEQDALKPDNETLHTSDPQEQMKGPVSSLMQKTGEAFDTQETKEQADKEREENI